MPTVPTGPEAAERVARANRVGSGVGYADLEPMLRIPVSHLPEPRVGQGTQGRARALLEALRKSEDPWITRLMTMEYVEDPETGRPIGGQMFRKDDGRRAPTIDPETEALRRAKIRAKLKGRKRPADVVERIRRGVKLQAIRRARARDPLREPFTGWVLGAADKHHEVVRTTFATDEE